MFVSAKFLSELLKKEGVAFVFTSFYDRHSFEVALQHFVILDPYLPETNTLPGLIQFVVIQLVIHLCEDATE